MKYIFNGRGGLVGCWVLEHVGGGGGGRSPLHLAKYDYCQMPILGRVGVPLAFSQIHLFWGGASHSPKYGLLASRLKRCMFAITGN